MSTDRLNKLFLMLQSVYKPPPRVYSNYSNVKLEPPQEAYIAEEYIGDESEIIEENGNKSEREKNEESLEMDEKKSESSEQDDEYTNVGSNFDYYEMWNLHYLNKQNLQP